MFNRVQYVTANNHSSSSAAVHSGVPQGSVLGPLLFLIYINDLTSSLSSNIHLFADDCVIFREITSNNDSLSLQSDLNKVAAWCSTWRMDLNIAKCKVMRVTRSANAPPKYYLSNVPLDPVSSYKYLGILITSNLSWAPHIAYITNNANRMLGYIRRNFSKAPSALKLLLYKTLIRSKLEYASSVWDPYHDNLVTSLERVQNNSARFILSNYNRIASISSMKSSLGLPSLASRRKISRLSTFHKLFHHPTLHNQLILNPQYISPRIDHRHKVGIASCNSQCFSRSFIPRTSVDWNHLPEDIVTITNNNIFRQTLLSIV